MGQGVAKWLSLAPSVHSGWAVFRMVRKILRGVVGREFVHLRNVKSSRPDGREDFLIHHITYDYLFLSDYKVVRNPL